MVTATTKNLDSVSIECMQLHHLSTDAIDSAWEDGIDGVNTEGLFYFPDSDPVVITQPPAEEEPVEGDLWVIPAESYEWHYFTGNPSLEFLRAFDDDIGDWAYIFDWTVDEGLVNLFNTPNAEGYTRRIKIEMSLISDVWAIYEIIGGVSAGDTELNLRFISSYDGADPISSGGFSNFYDLRITEMSFESTILMGDVNSDGTMNILDVVGVVNYIMGTGAIQAEYNADTNQDGNVNILDIVKMTNCILGTGSCDF